MTDRLKCPVCGIPTIEDRSGMTEEDALCNLHAEWSGYPDPDDPANYWIDDETGERVNAHTGEREPPKRKED